MSRLLVRPFEAGDVADAGALLADRHRAHRAAQPLLAARYEDASAAAAEVSGAFAAVGASGAVATRADKVVGFVLGAPKPIPIWGSNIWVEQAGQAATDAETIRDLYAVAATRWVDEGRTAHYVLTPATDVALVRAWFRLGFGQQHCHGLRRPPTGGSAAANATTVRRAVREDIAMLARLEIELPVHQGLSPTFSAGTIPSFEEAVAYWQDDIDSPDFATFVAEVEGKVIGSAVGCALEKSNSHAGLARPDNAGFLGFAAVLPSERGHGAGRALGEAVLAWTAEMGFDSVAADWRVTNLLSSRAWPALGFTESFVRLHRLIGQ